MRSYLIAIAVIAALGTGYYLMGGESETTTSADSPVSPEDEVELEAETTQASPTPRRMRASSPPPDPIRLGSENESDDFQTAGERHDRRQERRRARFERFDSNGDGELDEEERALLLQARVARGKERNLEFFDSDGDGELNEDELAMKEQAQRDIVADRATQIMGDSDTDENGFISQSEVEASTPRMRRLLQNFEEVDSDADGQVSEEELQEEMLARRKRREERARESAESE